jgi:putative FmdB family regulatory protein
MPTYEYECQSCHERIEAVQRFTDPALTNCTHCGGLLRKVFSAVGVVFKGSGFYKNDSRSPEKSSSPAATSTTPASTPSSESSTTPAATTATATATTSSATTSSD